MKTYLSFAIPAASLFCMLLLARDVFAAQTLCTTSVANYVGQGPVMQCSNAECNGPGTACIGVGLSNNFTATAASWNAATQKYDIITYAPNTVSVAQCRCMKDGVQQTGLATQWCCQTALVFPTGDPQDGALPGAHGKCGGQCPAGNTCTVQEYDPGHPTWGWDNFEAVCKP